MSCTPPFLTCALDGGELSASRHGFFTPAEEFCDTNQIWGPQSRSGCCGRVSNHLPLLGTETRPSSLYPSLYRMSYRGGWQKTKRWIDQPCCEPWSHDKIDLKKQNVKIWTGLFWISRANNVDILRTRYWTFCFHKKRPIASPWGWNKC
jgi:hypothetical protein